MVARDVTALRGREQMVGVSRSVTWDRMMNLRDKAALRIQPRFEREPHSAEGSRAGEPDLTAFTSTESNACFGITPHAGAHCYPSCRWRETVGEYRSRRVVRPGRIGVAEGQLERRAEAPGVVLACEPPPARIEQGSPARRLLNQPAHGRDKRFFIME